MYEWWNTPIETEELEDGSTNPDFEPDLSGAIDRFRRHLLIGIVNQHLGYLPSSLDSAQYSIWKDDSKPMIWSWDAAYDQNDWAVGNRWLDFLGELRMFIPRNCDYEYLMVRASQELNVLVNGHDSIGNVDNRTGKVPIDDPDLLDLLADYFGGLDGIFGLILATNPYVGSELKKELMRSEYYLTLPNTSTRKLLESSE